MNTTSSSPRAPTASAHEPPDELGIPGLQTSRKPRGSLKALLAGGLMFGSLLFVVGYSLWARFGPAHAQASPAQPVAADQLPPIDFKSHLDAPTDPAARSAANPATSASAPSAAIALRHPGAAGTAPVVPSINPAQTGGEGFVPGRPAEMRRDESPFISAVPVGFTPGAQPPASAKSPVSRDGSHPLDKAGANLEQYQGQLDQMLRQLQNLTDQASGSPGAATPAASPFAAVPSAQSGPAPGTANASRAPALFGQLERTQTPKAHATMLGNRSQIVAKGVMFQCALKTRIVSAVSGFVGCQVQRPVYSDDGKVVLIERGSHLDGEYRIVQVRPGVTRIPILWTRVRTPHGVTVDLESPATGALGDSGVTGEVNHRWVERIGAALLLSLIDDAIKLQISENSAGGGATVVMPNTAATTSRLAEKVLDSTINIPPLITTHQGSVVGVYVSRDLDFSGVYRLEAR